MKRFLVIVVIVVGVFAIGLYMGWFFVDSTNADGTSNITLTVDKDKIERDKDRIVGAVQDLGQEARDKAAAAMHEDQGKTAGVQPPQDQE